MRISQAAPLIVSIVAREWIERLIFERLARLRAAPLRIGRGDRKP